MVSFRQALATNFLIVAAGLPLYIQGVMENASFGPIRLKIFSQFQIFI